MQDLKEEQSKKSLNDILAGNFQFYKTIPGDEKLYNLTNTQINYERTKELDNGLAEFAKLISEKKLIGYNTVLRTYSQIDEALRKTGFSSNEKDSREIVDKLSDNPIGVTIKGNLLESNNRELYFRKTVNPKVETYQVSLDAYFETD